MIIQIFVEKKIPLLKNKYKWIIGLLLLLIVVSVPFLINGQKENDKTDSVKSESENTQPSTSSNNLNNQNYTIYKIDIKELSKKKKYASIGDELTISIKPQEIPSGEILFAGTKVKNGKISVKKKGKYIITYVVDGTVITDTTVEVRDK